MCLRSKQRVLRNRQAATRSKAKKKQQFQVSESTCDRELTDLITKDGKLWCLCGRQVGGEGGWKEPDSLQNLQTDQVCEVAMSAAVGRNQAFSRICTCMLKDKKPGLAWT